MAFHDQDTQDPRSTGLWLQKYTTADSNTFDIGSAELILALRSDQLDVEAIEGRVQTLARDADIAKGFCAPCRNVFANWPALAKREWDSGVLRYFDSEEVDAFSRAGCKFCAFIMGRFQHHEGLLDTFRKIEARLAAGRHPGKCSLAIQNIGGGIGRDAQSQALWVNLPGKEMTDVNQACDQELIEFVSEILPEDAKLCDDDTASLDLVKNWLSDCCESHNEQCSSRPSHDGPSRLISIQGEAIKLIETTSLDDLPQYATLTYCWGKAPFYKLTQNTYAEFGRDAITVARHLGLSYIWIDALCIVQDEPDKRDWLKESGQMRFVYGGSHVTLAASSASDVCQGFLTSALAPKYQGGFYAKVASDTYTRKQSFHSSGVFFESIMHTRLSGRAWAMQERLLSRRTVLFSEYGIFWQCHSTSRSEFIPGGFGGHPGPTLMYPDGEALPWLDVMCHYSEAKLTYPSDRLPALSGIAARQHEVTGDRYLAGLWEKDLVPSLLWFSLDPAQRPEWHAPSWSWASINASCSIKELAPKGSELQVRLLDAWTTLLGPDPFGPVTGGEITLACHSLIRATLDRTGFPSPDPRSSASESLQTKKIPLATIEKASLGPFPISLDCVERGAVENELVYLLPVVSGRVFMGYEDEDEDEDEKMDSEAPKTELAGLVLRPVADTIGVFTRLGIFGFSNAPLEPGMEQRDLHAEFKGILEQHGEATASSASLETNASEDHPNQRYVIKIK